MQPYYDDGQVTIYHGDCREVLPKIPATDLVLTDPPYGVAFVGKNTKHTRRTDDGYPAFEDTPQYIDEVVIPVIERFVAAGQRMILTPGSRNMFRYPVPTAVGTIFYPSGAGMGRWGFTCSQPIFYYGKDPYLAARMGSRPDSFSSTDAAPRNGHPCPKPINTMRWLVKKGSLPNQSILDPFMGSGTTMVAARDLERRAIGIEIEERYCEIAAKRLQQSALALAGD